MLIDADGTLCGKKNTIPKSAAEAVRLATDTDSDGLWNAFVYLKLIEGEMKNA